MSMGFFAAGAMGHGGPPSSITLLSITNTVEASASTSHAADMPATVTAGNLLVLIVTCRAASGSNIGLGTPSGWTKIGELGSGGAGIGQSTPVAVYYKVAAGTEGGTSVSFTSALSSNMAAQVHRLSGGGSASVTFDWGNSVMIANPPAHTSATGVGVIYWIAGFGSNGTAAPTGWPTGFNDAQTTTASGGSLPCRVISCAQLSADNPTNPDNITMAANTNSASFTISVPP